MPEGVVCIEVPKDEDVVWEEQMRNGWDMVGRT